METRQIRIAVHNTTFKGLGSSKVDDARRWFRDLRSYLRPLKNDEFAIHNFEIAFGQNTDKRKKIMTQTSVEKWGHNDPFTFSGFLEHFLYKNYWINELKKKIPHLMDGLCESQRKALFYMPTKSNRTAQQGAKIAEISNYEHGEVSMINSINNLAAVYKQNLHVFYPNGSFGSIDTYGGAAQARYTATCREKGIDLFFPEFTKFKSNLQYTEREGHTNEPDYLLPILPFVLVNGYSGGLAVGFFLHYFAIQCERHI